MELLIPKGRLAQIIKKNENYFNSTPIWFQIFILLADFFYDKQDLFLMINKLKPFDKHNQMRKSQSKEQKSDKQA